LLKILANGIGHKLLQQLFKACSLQFTKNYTHDSNHTMTLIKLHKDVNKNYGERIKQRDMVLISKRKTCMINQIYSYLLEKLEPRENYPCFDLLSYYTYVFFLHIRTIHHNKHVCSIPYKLLMLFLKHLFSLRNKCTQHTTFIIVYIIIYTC